MAKTNSHNEALAAKKREEAKLRKRRSRAQLRTDPQRHEEEKEKERQRWKRRKEAGKVKTIKELSRRDQKAQRKKWDEANKRRKDKQILESMTNRFIDVNSPPSSPCPDDPAPRDIEPQPSTSRQRVSGEKKRRKHNDKMKKELEKVKDKYKKEKKSKDKYKQKYYRLLKAKGSTTPSPNKIVKNIMKDKREVRRRLVFLEVMKKQMKRNTKNLTENEKNIVAKALHGNIVDMISPYLRKKLTRLLKTHGRSVNLKRKMKLGTYNKFMSVVTSFYEDDENSTQSPEKNAVISKKGVKKVKRYLNDSIVNLHKKFVETSKIKLSYTTFRRMKSFHLRERKLKERDTCSCIKHVNFNFKIQKLHMLGLLESRNMYDLMKKMCCNISNMDCMYRCCQTCNKSDFLYRPENLDLTSRTFFNEWKLCEHVYFNNKNEKTTTKIMTKQKHYCTVRELIESLKESIPIVFPHEYKAIRQIRAAKELKKNLKNNEVSLYCDFSENYILKYGEEVQSVHFGASQQQLSLHTGAFYFKENGELQHKTFATVSKNTYNVGTAFPKPPMPRVTPLENPTKETVGVRPKPAGKHTLLGDGR